MLRHLRRLPRRSGLGLHRPWLPAAMLAAFLFFSAQPLRAEQYLSVDAFLQQHFAEPPAAQVLWLTGQLKTDAAEILQRRPTLRSRYWSDGKRSAWVLDEIGKERPITIGIVIEDAKLAALQILAFRESRGGEVRYPFFTKQYKGIGLNSLALNQKVDGISGATLSFRAVNKAVRLALRMDAELQKQQEQRRAAPLAAVES